jgi:2-keto-4-pentenoate hydratase/2-oxohepta-3-ene-1,7-dioic acid hydratase in catechol pathway
MRLVQYDNGGQIGVGVQVDDEVRYTGYNDMLSFIRDEKRALDRAREAIASGRPVRYDKLIAPITNSGKIWGSGPNYLSHGAEDPDWEPSDEPMWDFIKLTSAVTGPYDDIVIPPTDDVIKRQPGGKPKFSEDGFAVDWEVEFAVVISKTAKNVRRADWLDHVFGYTIINDAGARSVQFYMGQRDVAKNFDTFSPMGPCIVTKDEIPDIAEVLIESYVNGERMQHEYVRDQLNPPDVAIEWLSSVIRLDPGDVLSTGTPAGCGTFMSPPRFLKVGDVVRCSASGIGHIENKVVQGTARTYPVGEPAVAVTA